MVDEWNFIFTDAIHFTFVAATFAEQSDSGLFGEGGLLTCSLLNHLVFLNPKHNLLSTEAGHTLNYFI